VSFSFILSDITKDVWIDDIYFYEKGNEKNNLIVNPGFEGTKAVEEEKEEVSSEDMAEIFGVADTENLLKKIKTSKSFAYDDIAKVMAGFKYSAVFPAHNITVDGDGADWGNYTQMYMPVISDQYYVMKEEQIVSGMDAKATYKFAYDEDNLYMIINVEDDIHIFYDNGADYWKGDSIQLALCQQGHTYDTEVSFVHNDDEKKGTVYSSNLKESDIADIKLSTKREGTITTYEAAIPWRLTFLTLPEKCLLSFLVNENDGLGRAYLIEVAPEGISISPKTSVDFPVLELVGDGKEWYSWIEGPTDITVGEEAVYDLFLVNRGGPRQVTIDLPLLGKKESITIPENSGIRREYTYIPSEYGEKNIECIVTEGKNAAKSSIDVFAKPSPEYFDGTIDEMRYKAKYLHNLIRRCEKEGISTDYESMRYTIYNRFITWFEDDLAHGEYSRSDYTLNALEEIYQKTKSALLSYLNGSEKPLDVPKYVTSKMEIDGARIIADMDYKGELVRRPFFATGFLIYDDEDIQYLDDFGYNFMHMGIGISSHMQIASGVKDWLAISHYNVGEPDHTLIRTDEDKASGNYSLKMDYRSEPQNNLYRTVYQSIPCKPNTTYRYGFKAKAENATAQVNVSPTGGSPYNERIKLPEGSFDWTSFDYEYTTGDTHDNLKIAFIFGGPVTFYLDDVYVYEGDSEENLLSNAGFEEEEREGVLAQDDYTLMAPWIKNLQDAEDNNVMVDLLYNVHYFLNKLYDKYDDLKYPGSGFVGYYYDHPVGRQVIDDHIRSLCKYIEQFENINSICVINEPWHTTNADDHYKPKWIEFLKETYNGDISELNKVYESDYKSFDEVPYYTGTKANVRLYDYVQFNDGVQMDFINYLVETTRKYTDLPVHAKVMQYFGADDIEKRWHLGDGANPEKMVDITDLNGNDSELLIKTPFDTYLNGRILQKSFLYDFNRSMKNAPVFNSEDHISNNGETIYTPDFAKNVRSEQWMSALHGRSMTAIWNWDRSRSRDYTADGITFRPDELETIATINLDLNRLAEYVYEVIEKPADYGVFLSTTTRILNQDHINSVYKVYENLIYQGVKPMFASDTQPELIHNYDTVFLPNCKNIQLKTLNELKTFVDNGGKLIIFGKDSISRDEHNQPLPEEIVSYIKSKAKIYDLETDSIHVTTPDDEIYNIIDEITKEKQEVVLIDTKTGKKVRNAEWQSAKFENINGESGILVNISNFDWNNDKTVELYINGKLVEKPFELRSDKYLDKTFTLKSFTPILIKVTE